MPTLTAPAPRAATTHEVARRALTVARRTALGVLGDREAAADVAQEVALKAVRAHTTLRDPAALDGWVYRVAVRAALREGRRTQRRRQAEQAGLGAVPTTSAAAELGGLLDLLDGLPRRQRAALTLRYAHDLDDQDIARALGCRVGTVRSLLSRGRDAVRERLDNQEENP